MAGFNTARRILPHWNWANGAFSNSQRARMHELFSNTGIKYRICVMHHPIHKAENAPLKVTVFGAHKTMEAMHALGVDLVLTGHVHYASITVIEKTVFASASTAISHRTRAQSNGFNVIDIYEKFFEITHFVYNNDSFFPSETKRHTKNR